MKAIISRYHPPTVNKGARITATDGDRNRVSISTDADYSTIEQQHRLAARALCNKMQWNSPFLSGWVRAGTYAHVFIPHDFHTTEEPEQKESQQWQKETES